MDINRYELILDRDNYTLVIYLDPQLAEFANELGRIPNNKTHLQVQIRDLIKEKFPTVPITAAKVMVGSMLVTTIYLNATVTPVGAQTTTTQVQQPSQFDVYRVQSGDSLSLIAKRFNVSVTAIKTLNGLTSDAIYVGQVLKLPFYTYTVVSGDSLSIIAKRFNTTADSIRSFNQLTSDMIFVGQKIKIPRSSEQNVTAPPPTTVENKSTGTYTVVAGDSLSLIAKKLNTTVETIRLLNNLTTDMIFIGQVLKVPQNQPTNPTIPAPTVTEPAPLPGNTTVTNPAPTPDTTTTTTTYTVISGDSLSLIAKKFATTVDAIKTQNKLTSDVIFVGQTLNIPQTQIVPVQPTEPTKEITTSYIVVPGDSLSLIAKRFNTTVDAIKTANQLSSDMIYVGQKLNIPTKETIPADTVAPTAPVLNPFGTITTKNQASLSVFGSTEANSTISITVTDGISSPLSIKIKADANGRFETKVDVSKLKDGNITITTTATDAAGNRSAESRVIVKKDTITTEPVIDITKQITIENVINYTIFGVTEPGAKVEITVSDGVNPAVITEATANVTGEFRSNVDLRSLNDGPLTMTARALDLAGNTSPVHQTIITKETSLAPAVIESKQMINSQNATNYMLFGIARPGSTIDITVSDGINQDVTATALANENGEFNVHVDLSSLQDTTLAIFTSQTSSTGIKSEISESTLVKDSTAPGAPVITNNGFVNLANQSSFIISGTGEANTRVNVRVTNVNGIPIEVSGQVNENGEYNIPVDLSTLNDGDILLEVTQMDQAENVSPLATKTLLKDTIALTNINIDSLTSIFSGNVNEYQISGTTDPNITLDILVTDGVSNLTKTITTDVNGRFQLPFDVSTLNDGAITVSYSVTDSAGNTSELQPMTITKDTTAPEAAVTTVATYVNILNQTLYSIMGTSAEEGSEVTMVISDGVTEMTKTVMVTNGSFKADFDLSSLKEGQLTFELTQTDTAGNKNIVQASTIEKDTLVENPIVSKNGFGFENQLPIYTIIGIAEPNAMITVSIKNVNGDELLTKSSTADSRGYYSISVNSEKMDTTGELNDTVSQTDLAGNTSSMTAVRLYSHTVSAGESLYTIAKRYNTTVDAIKALNQISFDFIQPGQTLRLPVTASEVINLGYMYFGNTKDYINMVNQTANSVNTVAPSYFDINSNGTLKLTYQLDTNFIANMHQRGIRVVPFLSNHWNREVGRAMLANKELAAQQIADAIERYNLDGVNVDIENVTEADRENYTEFVRLLREKIPSTKEVSVAVAANPNGWTKGWHGSYDYTNLAKYADYLMIMSYDESYPGGEAGPVASAPWVERSIQYAINQNVPTDKIVVGVAHYGRYWIEGLSYGGYGISNSQVENLIEKYNGTVVFDEISKTPKAMITIKVGDPTTIVGGTPLSPGTYTIWYENEESIRQKLSLVSQYNIRGVGNWSIGQENKDVWSSYATSLPTTVPVTSLNNNTDVTEPVATPTPVVSTVDYTVVSGDSLSVIAKRYNTTVTAIKEENRLTTDTIFVGQKLTITTTNTAQPTNTVNTYTVVSGDSLSVIAKRYNTTVTAIKEINGLTSDSIYIGQTLKIPGS